MKHANGASLASALGALGIVYGDIGTSVLYAFRECLAHGVGDHEGILGILSLIIWTLTLLVTVKYLTFVMRADNQGEGGILALLSLAFPESVRQAEKSKLTVAMIAVGLIGAALLYGDGVITPAISVLSATEGLSVVAPWLAPFTVPLTLAILAVLFIFQRKGTESVAKLFGPVMLAWFSTLAIIGILQVIRYPSVFFGHESLLRCALSELARRSVADNSGQRFSCGHGCRGALRGLGAFWAEADCPCVALGCLSLASSQLSRAGSTGLTQPWRTGKSFLSHSSRLGALTTYRLGHGSHCDRLASFDLRCFLSNHAGRADPRSARSSHAARRTVLSSRSKKRASF